jgi:chromosome segregation ATPase
VSEVDPSAVLHRMLLERDKAQLCLALAFLYGFPEAHRNLLIAAINKNNDLLAKQRDLLVQRQERIEELELANDDLRESLRDVKGSCDFFASERDRLLTLTGDLSQEVDRLSTKLDGANRTAREVNERHQSLKAKLDDRERALVRRNQKIETLEARNVDLQAQLNKAYNKLAMREPPEKALREAVESKNLFWARLQKAEKARLTLQIKLDAVRRNVSDMHDFLGGAKEPENDENA